MSLKAFHVFFISVSVLLCLGFGGWCFGHAGYLGFGVGAMVCAVALVAYEVMFLRKFRDTK